MSIPSRNTIDNLTEWLLLQIAEDEMKARTAGSEPWRWRVVDAPTQRDALVRPNGTICADSWGADRQETGFRGAEAKMFIERFNPERVLADCDSKRRMLARLQNLAKAWWTTTRSADEARGGHPRDGADVLEPPRLPRRMAPRPRDAQPAGRLLQLGLQFA